MATTAQRIALPNLPLVLAPMAGGPSTVALCDTVAKLGGLPFLAGGYLTSNALAADLNNLKAKRFGVNLFVPEISIQKEYIDYRQQIINKGYAKPDQLPVQPKYSNDEYVEKLNVVLDSNAEFVSFTFGYPSKNDVDRVHSANKKVVLNATSKPGIYAALSAGADVLVVQGAGAGGHSASVAGADDESELSALELTKYAVKQTNKPIFAAGGVGNQADVADLLNAGATAVQIGTLFLLANEAGTKKTHREALQHPGNRETVRTRAFTGRPARALTNKFITDLDAAAPQMYPEVHFLTALMRKEADEEGDPERLNLWAGTGFRGAMTGSAEEIVRRLFPGLKIRIENQD